MRTDDSGDRHRPHSARRHQRPCRDRRRELSAERFRKGDTFVAQGYVRDYTRDVDGQERTDEQFVAKRLGHDPNLTTYTVDRRPRAEREAPAAERGAASRNSTRPAPEQAGVEHDGLGR